MPYCNRHNNKIKNKSTTIIKISDSLWDRIVALLPTEKPNNTIGCHAIPFRKVFDGIVHLLRIWWRWKTLPSEYGSGSTGHRRFRQWVIMKIFKIAWIKLLKEDDNKRDQMDMVITWQYIYKVAFRGETWPEIILSIEAN